MSALVERLFMAAVSTWDVLGVYIGDRLGLYRTLAARGPSTSAELAHLERRFSGFPPPCAVALGSRVWRNASGR